MLAAFFASPGEVATLVVQHLLRRAHPSWQTRAECPHRVIQRRLRDECLKVHQFVSLEDAREKIEAWRLDYNQQRPHSALGHLTLSEFVTHRQETRTAANGASL